MPRAISVLRSVVLAAAVCVAAPSLAATFTVTRFDDANDGTCDSDCSLREAVIAANAAGGADTVILPAGSYDLTITDMMSGMDEDSAATGDLDIWAGGFTLEGAGSATTQIDARDLGSRAFHVLRQFSSSAITFRGVSIERADASGYAMSSGGAGIRIDESFPGLIVTLDDVAIDKTVGSSALRSVATLHMTDCTLAENATSSALELGTIKQNKTGSAATQIERTTFRENEGFAINAVKTESFSHQFQLFDSTLSHNNAVGASGIDAGIITTNSGKIWNATIADDGGYGLAAITDFYGTPTVEVQNSIFRGNAFGNVMPTSATDGATLPTSHGGNVLSDGGAGAFTQPSDQTSTNPLLLPLADNGGKTLTYDLDPGSPAIDAGLNAGTLASCPAFDQRGVARPQDGDGDSVAVCDAGAVEVPAPEPGATLLAAAALLALGVRARRC